MGKKLLLFLIIVTVSTALLVGCRAHIEYKLYIKYSKDFLETKVDITEVDQRTTFSDIKQSKTGEDEKVVLTGKAEDFKHKREYMEEEIREDGVVGPIPRENNDTWRFSLIMKLKKNYKYFDKAKNIQKYIRSIGLVFKNQIGTVVWSSYDYYINEEMQLVIDVVLPKSLEQDENAWKLYGNLELKLDESAIDIFLEPGVWARPFILHLQDMAPPCPPTSLMCNEWFLLSDVTGSLSYLKDEDRSKIKDPYYSNLYASVKEFQDSVQYIDSVKLFLDSEDPTYCKQSIYNLSQDRRNIYRWMMDDNQMVDFCAKYAVEGRPFLYSYLEIFYRHCSFNGRFYSEPKHVREYPLPDLVLVLAPPCHGSKICERLWNVRVTDSLVAVGQNSILFNGGYYYDSKNLDNEMIVDLNNRINEIVARLSTVNPEKDYYLMVQGWANAKSWSGKKLDYAVDSAYLGCHYYLINASDSVYTSEEANGFDHQQKINNQNLPVLRAISIRTLLANHLNPVSSLKGVGLIEGVALDEANAEYEGIPLDEIRDNRYMSTSLFIAEIDVQYRDSLSAYIVPFVTE